VPAKTAGNSIARLTDVLPAPLGPKTKFTVVNGPSVAPAGSKAGTLASFTLSITRISERQLKGRAGPRAIRYFVDNPRARVVRGSRYAKRS